MVPSCLDVMSSSPSRVWLMKRSARAILAPIFRLMSSCSDTFTRLPLASRSYELHFLDGRHGAGDPIVGLLHRGKVGRKDAAVIDVAEDKLAAERGDPAVIREAAGYRPPFVVVVHRDGIREAVLLAPVQDFRG